MDLAFNSFCDDGTMALSMALLENTTLQSLGLSWNRVGGKASLALSRMLSANHTLKSLDLDGNLLTEAGGRSILRSLLGESICKVTMRGCSFFEDTTILFDRSYPPPLLSFDLDLKDAYQACVLHELVGLACAKPGSKFLEVYAHAGRGRSRTPIVLQAVKQSGDRRSGSGIVVDTSTGTSWTPPESGFLSIKFEASRALPSSKDVLSEEASQRAMAFLMDQDADSDRMTFLGLILKDTYVTTAQAQKLIDQLSNMGLQPPKIVEMMWTRVVDAGNLYEFLVHNVEHAARRDVVSVLTHERFKFNRDNPTGHYRLDMSKKPHREVMLLLSMVHALEVQQERRDMRADTSQHQNWSNFRNSTLDKKLMEMTKVIKSNLPASGVLEFDYVSTTKAPPDASPATDAQVDAMQESLQLISPLTFDATPNFMLAVLQLQQAAARYYFTTSQVIRIVDYFETSKLQAAAVTALFGRTWDLENFDAVLDSLPDGVDKTVASRLGHMNILNPLKLARYYELNIQNPDERKLLKILLDIAPLEKGESLVEDYSTDLHLIDLYGGGIGRSVDERRPMVARMWYCDIGEKGNVPNWAAREKLLENFLVGGKPFPNRVHGIVRMYKQMEEAGYLTKRSPLRTTEIPRVYQQFLKHAMKSGRGSTST